MDTLAAPVNLLKSNRYWASQYESASRSDVNVTYYVGVYGLIVLTTMAFTILGDGFYLLGALSASRKIHTQLTTAILHTTFRWLDMTPIGRVISRFTHDISSVDGEVTGSLSSFRTFSKNLWPMLIFSTVEISLFLIVRFFSVVLMAPIFLVPGFIAGVLGAWIGNIYIKAQLSVKREMSKSKSPVISHFNASIAGLGNFFFHVTKHTYKLQYRSGHTVHNNRSPLALWISSITIQERQELSII